MNGLTTSRAHEIAEAVLIRGDLAQLSHEERGKYYVRVCDSLGLNPLTKPFEYLTLNGKLMLYARKDCTDQLRRVHGVSVTELQETEREGIFCVTAHVRDKDGRTDASKGAVNIVGLKGEALANALMKAETKAKRRATLSLCGLGFLDEVEVEDIPVIAKEAPGQTAISQRAIAKREAARPQPSNGPTQAFRASEAGQLNQPIDELPGDLGAPPGATTVNPQTGEITDRPTANPPLRIAAADEPAPSQITPPTETGAGLSLEEEAREAARRGRDALNALCKRVTKAQYKTTIEPMLAELGKIMRDAEEKEDDIPEFLDRKKAAEPTYADLVTE